MNIEKIVWGIFILVLFILVIVSLTWLAVNWDPNWFKTEGYAPILTNKKIPYKYWHKGPRCCGL